MTGASPIHDYMLSLSIGGGAALGSFTAAYGGDFELAWWFAVFSIGGFVAAHAIRGIFPGDSK